MLAGRPPFIGDQDAQIIGRQLFAPPPPLQQLAPQVDAGLAALVACMLAKDTRQRPTMMAVAGELLALRNGETGELTASKIGIVAANTVHLVQPRHTTLGQGAGQLASRRGLWAWSAAAALAAIVGAGALWQMYVHRERMESAAAPAAIHWTITSEPAGAEVLGADGVSLGRTPLVHELQPGPGATAVVLRQPGYADQRFDLRHDQEVKVHAVLVHKPAGSRPSEAKAIAGKGSREGREGRDRKEGREGKRTRSRSKSGSSSLHNSEVKLFAD